MSNVVNDSILKAKNKEFKLRSFLYAFITSFLMFLPFIIMQNGCFTYFGDFTSQTVVFNSQCNELFKNGQTSWCWWNNAGTDFVEAFSYYTLGSPFFYLTLLFPSSVVPYLLVPVMCLKIGLASLFAYMYIRQYVKKADSALVGALLYALSGWTIYNLFFYTFLDALIFFPLILYALDRFMTNNERGLVCFSVALCALDNYYFFFQIGLVTLVYFVIKCEKKEYRFKFKIFFTLAFEVLLGILISAVLLFPSVINILQMPRMSSDVNTAEISTDTFTNILNSFIRSPKEYLGILSGFFFTGATPGLYPLLDNSELEWASVSYGLPLISVIGIIPFIKNRRKHWLTSILILSFVFMFVPILNSAFNFGKAQYMRWTFMLVLFMALASVLVLEDKEFSLRKTTIFTGLFLVAICILPFILPQKINNKWSFGILNESDWNEGVWIVLCPVALASIIIFALIIRKRRINYKKCCKEFVLFTCIFVILSGVVSISIGTKVIRDYSTYPVEKYIKANVDFWDDSDNYRISTETQFYNMSQLLGYQGTENFQTFISNSTTDFYLYLGYSIGSSYSYYKNNAVKTFLSNKYYVTDKYGYSEYDKDEPDYKVPVVDKSGKLTLFGYSKLTSQSGYNIYQNDYYIPYGFTYDKYYLSNETKGLTIQQKSQLLLKGIMLTPEQEAKYSKIINKLDVDSATKNNTDLTYALDCKKILSRNTAENFTITDHGFTCSYNSDNDNLLFFSVPYHNGWKAYINGKEVNIEKVNVGFMAVQVSSGENEIEFKYENPIVKVCGFISIIAFLVYIIYLLCICLFKKKRDIN